MNWNKKYRPEEYGNILFNDCKFLKLLYSSYDDTFKGEEYVIDATNAVKQEYNPQQSISDVINTFVSVVSSNASRFLVNYILFGIF